MCDISQLQNVLAQLDEFKYEQQEYWQEIQELSDDHVQVEDLLPTIIENDEECELNEFKIITEQIQGMITALREGQIKIIERYKYELKQLALEMKEMSQDKQNAQTQTDLSSYQEMYHQELQKCLKYEKKIEQLTRTDGLLQKQEIQIEITSLRNKIQILTETSAEAETLIIRKDNQVKELQKQLQNTQKELTAKRGELSLQKEQLIQKDANLKLSVNLNKKYQEEIQQISQSQALNNHRPLQTNTSQLNAIHPRKQSSCYKSLAMEIQELTHENTQLKAQIQQVNRKLKDQELQQKQEEQNTNCKNIETIEELKNQLLMSQYQLEQMQQQREYIQPRYDDDELSEAMEYLQMKDLEIERLRKELDQYRRQNKDNAQVKDLQNLLMVMSRTLQEKERIIEELQQ